MGIACCCWLLSTPRVLQLFVLSQDINCPLGPEKYCMIYLTSQRPWCRCSALAFSDIHSRVLPEYGVYALDIFLGGINVRPDADGRTSKPYLALARAPLSFVGALRPLEWYYVYQDFMSADYRPGVFSKHRSDKVRIR